MIRFLIIFVVVFGVVQTRADTTPPQALTGIGIDQKLDQQVPGDLIFKDETGREIRLGDYFYHNRPIILSLVYFRCPMLCSMVLNDLTRSLNGLPMNVGEKFDVITVSFDPREPPDLAAAKKSQYLREYRRAGASDGWHFLTGTESSIKALTDSVGFRYAYDEKVDQYIHASGIMILTPEGKISRYFYGIDYAPTDLRLALLEASGGKIGSPVERLLLYCFHYDPSTGKYSLLVTRLLQFAAIATLAVMGSFFVVMRRREKRREAVS